MAIEQIRQSASSDNETAIQVLNRLWENANAAYDAIDAATPTEQDPTSRVWASWFRDGEAQVYRRASHLQLALLYEQPTCMADAVILSGHIHAHGSEIDGIVDKYREEAFAALERALSSLFAFLAEETGTDFNGWMRSGLLSAKREVALRVGKPEEWVPLSEAA